MKDMNRCIEHRDDPVTVYQDLDEATIALLAKIQQSGESGRSD